MKRHLFSTPQTVWLLVLLSLLSAGVLIKGCRRDRYPRTPASPANSHSTGISLKMIPGEIPPTMKATGLRVEVVGLDESGLPTGETTTPVEILNPVFPLDVDLEVYVPPCTYQVTATISLVRDPPRITVFEVNACQQTNVTVAVDTFERVIIDSWANPLHVPASALAGETITARCGPVDLSAPDSDRYPLSATLTEDGGQSISGPIGPDHEVSDDFPDVQLVAV